MVAYETDPGASVLLQKTLQEAVEVYGRVGGTLSWEVVSEDFVLSRPDRSAKDFDISILNPPYFKVHSTLSHYSGATKDIFGGNPNIYAAFMAVVGNMLTDNGQLVSITPRSFTNGLYFKKFRDWLLGNFEIEHIHIFRSRKDAFRENAVLQENIVCKFRKTNQTIENVTVSTSKGRDDVRLAESRRYERDLIVDAADGLNFIRIPEDEDDAEILRAVDAWPETFDGSNYRISTGPVVTFRQRSYIEHALDAPEWVPLIQMHNVRPFRIEWTGDHKKDSRFGLLPRYQRYVSQNRTSVVLKRFSAKDEKRRLVAGVHVKGTFPGFVIPFENHLRAPRKLMR